MSLSRHVLMLAFLILLVVQLQGQDFKKQYKEGKELFRKEEYVQALEAFRPLITYDRNNPYTDYASYYYGLSAMRLGFLKIARDSFIQLKKLHPQWNQMDEVNFLLAKIYFDQHDYFQSLRVMREIQSWPVTLEGKAMKQFYLSRVGDLETLRMMLEENPDDEDIARVMVSLLAYQPSPRRDVPLMDSLISRFKFDRANFPSDSVIVSRKKERYNISLLLPFMVNTLDPTPVKKKNQFVLDLYEGMKLGVDSLELAQAPVDLYAYDTDRGTESLKALLDYEELKSTDLLVGPIFQDQIHMVHDFSIRNRINVINPVSNNADFIGKNTQAFLFQPSHETLGQRSAELVASKAKRKNCIVFYGDTPKDSVKAFGFIKRALELGVKVVLTEEINKETSGKIYTTLASPTEYDEFKNPKQFTLRRDSIGSIYVATDDPVIFTKVISGVETRGDSVMIVGNENWIAAENSSIDYSILERLNVIMEAPNYVSPHDPEYQQFKGKFLHKHGTLPSEYSWLGYKFILFIGQAMKMSGVYFQQGFGREDQQSGFLIRHYDFRGGRSNQFVPFIHFVSGELAPFPKP